MCGFLNIVNIGSIKNSYQNIFNEFKKINQRGPDNTKKIEISNYTAMFHRLSIIDLNKDLISLCSLHVKDFCLLLMVKYTIIWS